MTDFSPLRREALSGTLAEAHRAALRAVASARHTITQRDPAKFQARPKGSGRDLVSDLDIQSENSMVGEIRKAFPEHRIVSEEGGGFDGTPEWTWLVDPLDGTNNVALGLPLCGSCATLCHDGEPVVAAIYVAHEDATYSAVRGHGALRNGAPVRICFEDEPENATISWINGYGVAPDDAWSIRARALLDRRFKRTLSLWSPSVDWSLLVTGRSGALLAYKNEAEDLLCGVLIATEAGAVLADFSGNPITDVQAAEGLVVAAPTVAPYLANVLSELAIEGATP